MSPACTIRSLKQRRGRMPHEGDSMSDTRHESAPAGAADVPVLSNRVVELAVALFTAGLGAVVMAGSYQQGTGWNDAGPESGYFPFYIGLIMTAASLGTIALTIVNWR